ncbi:MAG: hypothetical protein EOO40_03480 [Deltaproteobacteria bacterium]|nr:MAG: hypothetical protein EOO40_03480 [Deltaproteobacteria bacterium]
MTSASLRQSLAALHTLIGRAEAAAVRCNGHLLTEIGREIAIIFDEAPLQELSEVELQDLRGKLVRYRALCATLSKTLRAALLQACNPPIVRYEGRGTSLLEERARAYIQHYG